MCVCVGEGGGKGVTLPPHTHAHTHTLGTPLGFSDANYQNYGPSIYFKAFFKSGKLLVHVLFLNPSWHLLNAIQYLLFNF